MDCLRMKDDLLRFIDSELTVSRFDEQHCIVTLPLMTLDGRYLDVHVEERDGSITVHDGGRTVSELYAQGVHMNTKRFGVFFDLARRYGAYFDRQDDAFRITGSGVNVQEAVLTIAQCASLAMHDVVNRRPTAGSVDVPYLVKRTMMQWRTPDFNIHKDFPLVGTSGKAVHHFDYLADPTKPGARKVAVQVLSRTVASHFQARTYGFLVLDLKGTDYDSWPRIAVVSGAVNWDRKSLEIVKSLSDRTITVTTGIGARKDVDSIPNQVEELAYSA